MSGIWYKRKPADWLSGVATLTAEERGVYDTLLEMMYDQGGSVPYLEKARPDKPASPARLASACGTSTRRFNIILGRLKKDGKVIHRYDRLFNKKVFKELNRDFISTLSRHYLFLIFPEVWKIKGLPPPKNLEPRSYKEIYKESEFSGVDNSAPELDLATPDSQLQEAVVSNHGAAAWNSWFSSDKITIEGKIISPSTKFTGSYIKNNYGDILNALGFSVGDVLPRKAKAGQ